VPAPVGYSVGTFGGGNMGFGSGSNDYDAADHVPFSKVLSDLRSSSTNPQSVRLAACAAALAETAEERRSGTENVDEATATEMFLASLAALRSLEEQHRSNAEHTASVTSSELVAFLPLLEILRRVLPHAAHPSNNNGAVAAHQFGELSRSLRMSVALAYEGVGGETSKKNDRKGGGGGGPNALLRQVMRTSVAALAASSALEGVREKDLARLLHGTLVPVLHDGRPKVRKAAMGCAVEIVLLANAKEAVREEEEEMSEEERQQRSQWRRRRQQGRRAVADFLWEYSHAVLTKAASNDDDDKAGVDGAKVIHILRFLSSALPHADDSRIRVRFGEKCLELATTVGIVGGDAADENGGAGGAELAREALAALLVCIEPGEREQEADDEDERMASSGGFDEETSKFAARALTSLLQHRPGATASATAVDLPAVHARCLFACTERMILPAGGASSKLLAMKLLPNVISSLLRSCDGGAGEAGASSAEACASEFNRFSSRILPAVTSCLVANDEDGDDAKTLRRIAVSCVGSCVPVMEGALQIGHRSAWGSILPGGYAAFLAALASASLALRGGGDADLESSTHTWMKTLVSSLLRLREDVEKDGTARSAVEYAASAVARGVGLELFLTLVDFVDDDDTGVKRAKTIAGSTTGGGIRDDRAWLLPIMKHSFSVTASHSSAYICTGAGAASTSTPTSTRLSYFQGRVLQLARRCDAASASGQRTAAEESIQKSRAIEVWSLFPSFCVCPEDMKESFAALAKTLARALGDHGRYPKLVPIICVGLKTLAVGVMERAEAASSLRAKEDLDVLSVTSTKLLPTLFKLVEALNQAPSPTKKSGGKDDDMETDDAPSSEKQQAVSQQNTQRVEAVIEAIGQLAQCCPRDFLQTLFKKVVQRLLVATTDAAAEEASKDKDEKNATALRMCSLLGLGQALVASGSLDDASLSLLYRAVRPLVRTDEHDPRAQKKAYKVLAEICERHKDFATSDERLAEMVELMVDSIVTCQVSARNMRLKCMKFIVEGMDSSNEEHMVIIPKIMGEVLLCLKDSNGKTREAAYQLLLSMATARDDMTDFFKIVLAALGAQTPHMRSAAVMALSRLIFEYSRDDYTVQSLIPSLLTTASVLFDDQSREVTKSVIGFIRVCVAAMTRDQLEPILPEVVGGILKYNKGRGRFRAKIKIILKKLVRTYGYDAINPHIPEKDARLMTHMRKVSERAQRRKATGVKDGQSVANNFEDMMESDEEDSDDGRTFMTGVTGFTKMTATSGKGAKSAAMERSLKAKSVRSGAQSTATAKSAGGGPRIRAENGEVLDMLDASRMARSVRFADERKYGDDSSDDDDDDEAVEFNDQGKMVISEGMPRIGNIGLDDHDEGDDEENLELKAGGKRRRVSKFEAVKLAKADGESKSQKRKKRKDTQKSLGSAYKAKNAGGDLQKKGQQYEPYAYVPLNAKDFTKKNRGKAVTQMGDVVAKKKRKRG